MRYPIWVFSSFNSLLVIYSSSPVYYALLLNPFPGYLLNNFYYIIRFPLLIRFMRDLINRYTFVRSSFDPFTLRASTSFKNKII